MRSRQFFGLVVCACLVTIGLNSAAGDELQVSLFGSEPCPIADAAPLAISLFGESDPFLEVRAPLHVAMFGERQAAPVEAPRPKAKQLLVFKSAACGQPCIDLENKTLAALRSTRWIVSPDERATIRTVSIEDHPELAARYAIEAVPTFVMLEYGFEVERHVGLIDPWAVGKIYNGDNRKQLAHR